MNAHIQLLYMGLAATTAVTAGFFAHIYREKQGLYLRPWALACCLVALRSVGLAVAPAVGRSAWLLALNGWLIEAAGLAFLWSAWEYVEAPPKLPLLGSLAAGFALWSVAYRFHKVPVAPNFGAAAVFLYIACVLLSGWPPQTRDCGLADGFRISRVGAASGAGNLLWTTGNQGAA